MNILYNSILLCSSFLSIQWFILIVYKILSIKLKNEYEKNGHLVKFKFLYVSLMLTFIIFIYIALYKWYKYQLLFSIIEGILTFLITVGIAIFLYSNHKLTVKSSYLTTDKNLYLLIRKYTAVIVSFCILLLDIFPFLI